MKLYLLTTALLALALPAAAAPILTPSTTTYGGILNGSNFATGAPTNTFSPPSNGWPSVQGPTKAVDGIIGPGSKYLNLNVNNTALLFAGTTQRVADRMELWVAEDAVERDPASYILYGTNNVITPLSGGTVFGLPSFGFVEIGSGTLTLPATRDTTADSTGFSQIIPIPNTTAYASYLLVFPTVKGPNANSMQISEVQLYDSSIIGSEQFDYSDGPIATRSGGQLWNRRNQNPGPGYTTGRSDWDGTASVANGRLTTNNSAAEREYKGPGEGLPISTDEGLGTISAFNNGALSFQFKTVYYRATFTTGDTLPDSLSLISSDFGTDSVAFGLLTGSGNFSIRDIRNASAQTNSATAVAANTTYTIVAKLDFGNSVTGTASFFLDPDLNAAEPALPTVTRPFNSSFWSSRLKLASTGGSAVAWDNLVVAATWDELGTVVTTLADEDNGILGGGAGTSLREAVKYSPTGSLITFAPGLSGQTITLTHSDGDMEIPQAVTIDASALPGGITVSGNNTSRHFYVGSGKSLNLRGLTLTGGNGSGAGVNSNSGGAINNDGGTLTLTQCTLSDNSARLSSAGAIFNRFGTLTLTQCTLSGNYASGGGGAISNFGPLRLSRCTLSGNSASIGGAIDNVGDTLELANSIVAGNSLTGTGSGADVYNQGTLARVGANLVQSLVNFGSGSVTGPGTISTADPKLSPLGYFGGPVQTMHPLIGSPAIDAADTADPGGTDARGFPRFVSGDDVVGTRVDIGAVEAGRRLFVNQPGDDLFGGTLRNIIDISGDFGPGTILVCDASISPLTLTQGELDTPTGHTLFIDASHIPGGLTISGNNQFRVFNIPATSTVAMHSLRIVNGNVTGDLGGGIFNSGTCTLINSTLSGNLATSGSGGGIGNLGACTVHSSTLSDNTATFVGGGIFNSGTCTVLSSTLSGNSGSLGGGIFNSGTCTVLSSTLSGNLAAERGGGIHNNNSITGPFHLSSSIVAGNTAPNDANVSNTFNSNINNLTSGDPLLSPLDDYGGPTQTMPPLPGSPAIDAAGPVSEVQQVAISALPAVFTLSFNGATTGSLNQFLTASDVATTLQNLGTIGAGNVTVEKTTNPASDTFFRITFVGTRGGLNQPQLISSNIAAQVTTVLDGTPASLLATDQRGFSRPRDGDGNGTALSDLGAVEANIALVTTLADTGPGSFRAALAEVAAQPGPDTIFFASSLDGGTITLANAFDVADVSPVTIDATALSVGLTLSGGNASRHFTVQNGSTLKLRGLTLTKGNRSGGVGGSILNQGTLDLVRCTFTGNSAVFGGAIHTTGDSLQAQYTTFFGNTANTGGAIYVNAGDLTLTSSTLSGNTAESAAAIFKDGIGAATVTNCTVAGNHGTSGNGAIVAFAGTLDIVYSTISQNVGTGAGGGLYYKSPASVSLYASIIAGNTDTSSSVVGPDIYKGDPTAGIFLSDKNFIGTLANSGIAPGPDILVGDPKLSPLGDFGGPVQTMHPLIGSPAIDGSLDETPSDATDARGFPGLVDGDIASPGAQYDLGAVEAGPLSIVSNAADTLASTTFRTRINNAAGIAGARIGFLAATFPATITLNGTELEIPATPGLFIDASNLAAPVTISGNNATRVFNIMQGATVAMHSLKIVDGNSSGDGGGVRNDATLTLMSSTLHSNWSESSGGGLTNFGTCAMHDSTVSGNTTVSGGGGGIRNSGFLTVFSSTFSGNLAPSSEGGGIRNFGTCTIHSSTISGNSAFQGSGIYNADTCELTSTIVAGNISDNVAGSYTGSSNLIGLDPLLAPLGDYGGPTQTMPPLRGSPAIDAGAATTARTDQRGGSRSRDGDGDFTALPDIGAVEASLIPVTTINDSGSGSLRAALAEASTHPGPDTLFFTTLFIIPSISTDITLADEIVIDDPAGVILDASDLPNGIVIDAGPGTNRHFRIAAGTPAVFQRLRLHGGNGTGGGGTTDGGSIHTSGILTLRECTIADNTTPSSAGAILSDHPGVLTLERCTLYGNFANAGGGAITQLSQNLLTLTACTIAINSAGSEAGGINAPFGRPVLLDHCTVTGNTVTQAGANGVGGVRGDGGGVPGVTVRNSIISGNTDANFPGTPNLSAFRTLQENNLIGGDPKLAPFGDYGGLTFTAPPIPGSPAINAATGSTTNFDQRGFARVGTADLGAAEFRGAEDVRLYWLSDWDGDGQAFGLEHALGTDPLRSDRGNSRNLTIPSFDGLGRTQLTFGVNAGSTPGTKWILERSTDLVNFTEIFRFDGENYFFNNTQVSVLDNGTTITVIDRVPPVGKGFYRFDAEAP